MSSRLIVFLPSVVGAPVIWRRLSETGQVVDEGVFEAAADTIGDEPVTVILPASSVAVRWLEVPPGRPSQRAVAAQWMLADQLGQEADDLQIVTGPVGTKGLIVAAAIDKTRYQAWRAWLANLGLGQGSLVPDCLCLEPIEDQVVLAPLADGDVVLIAEGLSATVQDDLVETLVAGRPVVRLEPRDVINRLATGSVSAPLVFSDQPQKVPISRGGWRRVALLVTAVTLSPLLLILLEIVRDHRKAAVALDQAKAEVVAYWPDMAGDTHALSSAEVRLAEAAPAGGQVHVLARLNQAIEQVEGVKVTELDARGHQMSGVFNLPNAEIVESLTTALEAHGLDLTSCDALQEQGRVLCTFSLKVRS